MRTQFSPTPQNARAMTARSAIGPGYQLTGPSERTIGLAMGRPAARRDRPDRLATAMTRPARRRVRRHG